MNPQNMALGTDPKWIAAMQSQVNYVVHPDDCRKMLAAAMRQLFLDSAVQRLVGNHRYTLRQTVEFLAIKLPDILEKRRA